MAIAWVAGSRSRGERATSGWITRAIPRN